MFLLFLSKKCRGVVLSTSKNLVDIKIFGKMNRGLSITHIPENVHNFSPGDILDFNIGKSKEQRGNEIVERIVAVNPKKIKNINGGEGKIFSISVTKESSSEQNEKCRNCSRITVSCQGLLAGEKKEFNYCGETIFSPGDEVFLRFFSNDNGKTSHLDISEIIKKK